MEPTRRRGSALAAPSRPRQQPADWAPGAGDRAALSTIAMVSLGARHLVRDLARAGNERGFGQAHSDLLNPEEVDAGCGEPAFALEGELRVGDTESTPTAT